MLPIPTKTAPLWIGRGDRSLITADDLCGVKAWLHAFRLRTLPLAISSIIVGGALAYEHGSFNANVLGLTLITAILLQVLSNLSNDLGDHLHGVDNSDRNGPARSVQSGAISTAAMQRAMLIVSSLAFLSGLWLIIMVFGLSLPMLAFLLLGVLALGAAVKYTFGKDPYGYAGLGDVSVFVFFGLVGVIGSFYLHTSEFNTAVLMPAIAFGLLSTGVLNVNNMRDIQNDSANGKITVAVRLGIQKARIYHSGLIVIPLLLLMVFTYGKIGSNWKWLFLVGYLPIVIHFFGIWRKSDPATFDPELKRLALGTFATAITFSIGLLLS